MSNKLDDFVDQLQEQIYDEAKTALGKKGFERWLNPRYRGIIKSPDGYASITGACGDTMQMFLRIQDLRIKVAAFMTDGCGPTVACGSMWTRMAEGESLEEVAAIKAADLIIALDGLPPEHIHCATLAVHTMRQAMAACCPKDEVRSE